jgi:hypothetical protein
VEIAYASQSMEKILIHVLMIVVEHRLIVIMMEDVTPRLEKHLIIVRMIARSLWTVILIPSVIVGNYVNHARIVVLYRNVAMERVMAQKIV